MSDKYAHLRPTRDRQCYRSDGIPKKRFTRLEARAKAALYPGYHAYRCDECGHWHTGRNTDSANESPTPAGDGLELDHDTKTPLNPNKP